MPKPTLLLIDDDPHVLFAYRQVFRREPYTVLTAEGAKQALDLLGENRIDILISDHRMPEMTGLELLREVRCSYPDVIRILVTGVLDEEDLARATEHEDIQRLIYKPWDVDELLALVREVAAQIGAGDTDAKS